MFPIASWFNQCTGAKPARRTTIDAQARPQNWNHVRRRASNGWAAPVTSGSENRSLMVLSPSKSAALVVLLTVLPTRPVLSLHELDHRYDVMGYILGADRQSISGVHVVGHVDGDRMGSGRSDSNGYYRFRMHLHDSDLGRELRLTTPEHHGTVRISLTPGDASTERIHHVNFVGGKLVEGELPGRTGISTTMVAVGAGAALLLASLFTARHLRRMHRRRQRARQKAATVRSRSSSNRGKRKKRRR